MRTHFGRLFHAARWPLAMLAWRGVARRKTLRIGLAEDPDVLDPTLARTFVGRIVFAALCDKLFDIDEKLTIVPQLATAYEWSADSKALTIKLRPGVTFHDGEKLDAAAVKYNLERHKTMPGSQPPRRARAGRERRRRRSDDGAAQSVGAVRAAARAARRPRRHDGLARRPRRPPATSSAPSRCARDRSSSSSASRRTASCSSAIPNYWNKGEIHFDRIVYLPIVDSTVRLANLQVGPARLHRAAGALRRARSSRPTAASRSRRSPRSATRASRSTSARATSRRRTRSARIRACARRSSWRSTARASCRW